MTGRRGQSHGTPRHSVFRYVLARGLVILAIIVALGVVATASLFNRATEEQALAERHLPLFTTASQLFAGTTTLAGLSTRLLTVETKPEVLTLRDRMADRSAAVAAAIDRLEGLGLDPDKADRARQVHRHLSEGGDALAALTERILSARRAGATNADLEGLLKRRDGLILRQELVASEMTTLVSGLARETELQVIAFQENAARSARILTAGLVLAAVAAVLAVLGIYRGLRRHMLDRLRAITEALRAWRHGAPVTVAVDGHGDEISEMAAALHDLMGAVGRRTEELAVQAQTDMLTGMYNRRGFQDRAEAELARAARYGTPLSVLVGDIDHFKLVNDSHGHAIGDAALRHVAGIWRSVLREMDTAGRLGGEEFAAILPHTGAVDASVVAQRIRLDIEDGTIPIPGGANLLLTISIGVATLEPGEGLASLLARADTALYAAKRGGRNRVCAAQAEPIDRAESQVW